MHLARSSTGSVLDLHACCMQVCSFQIQKSDVAVTYAGDTAILASRNDSVAPSRNLQTNLIGIG